MNSEVKQAVEAGGLTAQILEVGVDDAKYLLGLNTKNRKMSAATIRRMARTMSGDRWVDGVSNVAVGSDGALCNGQHTLATIVETGVPAVVTLTVGIDPDARAVFDTGNRRSLAGTLQINGKMNTVNLASGAQLARRYEEMAAAGRPVSSMTARLVNYDPLEMVDWVEELGDDLTQGAIHMQKSCWKALGENLKPSALSAFFILALRADAEEAARAHESITYGAGLQLGDPYLALRNWATHAERKRDAAGKQLATIAKAWSRKRAGQEMRMAHLRTNEVLSPID